ncbi:MAG: PEP-CTERM sorting domain-containing protein [bacterium]|nr:PEP-CTERM sorting domain-containing protein [bacterium]
MKRIIWLSLFFLLLTLNAAAKERHLQAAVPGEAGTIGLRVTLNEAHPAVLENYSGLSPEPEAAAVPEPTTLGLLGLGVLGLLAARLRRTRQ